MMNCLYKEFDFPFDALRLAQYLSEEEGFFFLDSSQVDERRGRYSFIGISPFGYVSESDDAATLSLRSKFNQFSQTVQCAQTPLPAGMVGVLAYDYHFPCHKIKKTSINDLGTPDCHFGLYDCIFTVDHKREKLIVTSSGLPEENCGKRLQRAQARLDQFVEKMDIFLNNENQNKESILFQDNINDEVLRTNFTQREYCQAVEKALDYIAQGDIYQVNLSKRFKCDNKSNADAIDIYEILRGYSPSSFGGVYTTGQFQVVSSSPEMFLRVMNGIIETRPMKGTRPRGKTRQEDEQLKEEIIQSPKDKAELLMITDLERNDFGKVCEFGSINVEEIRTIEEYQTVFQTVSHITGKLSKDKNMVDAIEACFPGGSITGCPKLRSMEIIEELEPTRRSVYTGSLGYISFSQGMEFNILIRTLLLKDNQIYFQVGSGIVADSIPEDEYKETLLKAKAMMKCVATVNQSLRPLTKACPS